MNEPHPAVVTRRSALASVGAIASLTALSCAGADDKKTPGAGPPTRKLSQLREEFERLLPLWKEERKKYELSSDTYDYWQGPNGKAIIALGPAIIPYLITQVRAGDFWFNVPLAIITKVDVANGNYVSEQANAKLWVEWWESAKK
jgi:hypothetical protein